MSSLSPLVICADIGAVQSGNFGWAAARIDGTHVGEGDNPRGLVELLVHSLRAEIPCALGFEAPLFVPVRNDPAQLTRGRNGEGSRPWSAGAGTGVLATGLVQASWIFRAVYEQLGAVSVTYGPAELEKSGLLVWEAFVSAKAKGATHIDDARAAVGAFIAAWPDLHRASRVKEDGDVLSLVGATIVWSRICEDDALIRRPCAVIAP
jgi:hypothetical protein